MGVFLIVLCEILVVDWDAVCLWQASCYMATNQMRVDWTREFL